MSRRYCIDATPTIIGFIPVAPNETVDVIAKVVGVKYNAQASAKWITGKLQARFYRSISGDIVLRGVYQRLVDEGTAAFDVDLVVSTGGSDSPASLTAAATQAIMIKVTGSSAGATTIVWTASVEVQRISDKTYER